MLLQFRAKDFRSIADEQILDLRPAKQRQHRGNIFEARNTKARKTLGLYGANVRDHDHGDKEK